MARASSSKSPAPKAAFAGIEPVELWFEQAGELISISTGARGSPEEARIALAVPDTNHFDDTIRQIGQTMAVLDRGYSQVLPLSRYYTVCTMRHGRKLRPYGRAIHRGCQWPAAWLLRNYAESAIQLAAHLTPTVMQSLDIDARRDLAVFQDAALGRAWRARVPARPRPPPDPTARSDDGRRRPARRDRLSARGRNACLHAR